MQLQQSCWHSTLCYFLYYACLGPFRSVLREGLWLFVSGGWDSMLHPVLSFQQLLSVVLAVAVLVW